MHDFSNFAVIIPARLGSTRLPRKPLSEIGGIPMIGRVVECALSSKFENVYVACDSHEIFDVAEEYGAQACITDPDLPSGADRIYAALRKLEKRPQYVINLQGDIPFFDPEILNTLAESALEDDTLDIITLAYEMKNEDWENENVVKVSLDENNFALNFARSAYVSDNVFGHIGIYLYKYSALEKFVQLKSSETEISRRLEQMRAMDNGIAIKVEKIRDCPLSVDTMDDLGRVRMLHASGDASVS